MQICKECVLDNNFPGITFDRNGVCNFCRSSKRRDVQTLLKKRYEDKFIELVKKYKGKGIYDCLVAYSGGKDSTYTLNLMKNRYNLKIMAFSFDNWFQSEVALQNIRKVIKHINVDHLTITPSFEAFKTMIHASLSSNLYSMKALERATFICTTCLSLIRFISFKIAIEKEIPFVVFGLSPGQAPIVTSVFKTNAGIVKKMQNVIFQPLLKHTGDIIKPYFLENRHFTKQDSFPYSINPLAFLHYDEEEIYRCNKALGWQRPEDTDANSTNCLLNAFANKVHIKRYGFHPYAWEIANMVREGVMTREEGYKKIYSEQPANLGEIAKKLGM